MIEFMDATTSLLHTSIRQDVGRIDRILEQVLTEGDNRTGEAVSPET